MAKTTYNLHLKGFVGGADFDRIIEYSEMCDKHGADAIDDMEEYKASIEDETGAPIRNRDRLPHYTFLCWLCYEEYGFQIARTLFPETF